MYHVGEGTRPCQFPVTRNGHGRVTEPKGDQYSGRNLGMIPFFTENVTSDTKMQYCNAIMKFPSRIMHNKRNKKTIPGIQQHALTNEKRLEILGKLFLF